MQTRLNFSRLALLLALVVGGLMAGCSKTDVATTRGIYHWKNTFNPSPWEKQFLKKHHIEKLYLKLFEVDANNDGRSADYPVVPVATTRFEQTVPEGMTIVPCVYITTDALKACSNIPMLAYHIARRISDMANCNGFEYHEVQLDCDWTTSTRQTYFDLCAEIDKILDKDSISLESTVRMYQLSQPELMDIPADRLTLMAYNLGGLQHYDTRNSILDYDDAVPFLKKVSRLPDNMDFAFPTFGWGVEFRTWIDDSVLRTNAVLRHSDLNKDWCDFSRLIRSTDFEKDTLLEQYDDTGLSRYYEAMQEHVIENSPVYNNHESGYTCLSIIREEHGEVGEILKTKKDINSRHHGNTPYTTILYHLDSANLSYYSYHEIEKIYNR